MTVHLMVTEFYSLIWKFLISLRSSSARTTHTAFFTIQGQFGLKIQNNNWTKIEQLCEYDMWHLIDQKLSASIFIQYYLFIYLKIIHSVYLS
jgi:hypothetical protein